MPSAEFARIMKDLAVIGDTCTIACDKDGVTFSVEGDLGKGNIMVRNNTSVDKEEVSHQLQISASTPMHCYYKRKKERPPQMRFKGGFFLEFHTAIQKVNFDQAGKDETLEGGGGYGVRSHALKFSL